MLRADGSTLALERRLRRAGWASAVAALGFSSLGAVPAIAVLGFRTWATESSPGGILSGIVLPVLAALILDSRPRNRLAWLLMACGVSGAVGGVGDGYARASYARLADGGESFTGAQISAWATFALPMSFALFAVLVALFPDGRATTRPQRTLAACAVLATVLLGPVLAAASWPRRGAELLDNEHAPAGRLGGVIFGVAASGQTLTLLVLVGTLVRLAMRIRAEDRPVRRQTEWLLYGVGATIVVTLVGLMLPQGAAQVLAAAGRLAPAAAVAIAVSRHRLYDIDRLVSRTLVYLLVSGFVVATYVAVSVSVGALVGQGSVGVATGTLAGAAVGLPVRRRVQRFVDRRLHRPVVAAIAAIDRFVADVRAGVADAEDVEGLLRETLRAPSLQLGVHTEDRGLLTRHGIPLTVPQDGVVLEVAGTAGRVVVAPGEDLPDPPVVRALLEAARFPVEVAALQAQLRLRLEEVQASRRRLVSTADEERRRLERDIHDGAQQRLVALGLRLRLAEREVGGDDVLDAAVAEIGCALAELRDLAHGLYPRALTEDGLTTALHEMATRSPIATTVSVSGPRPPAPIEVTAWFVACEGLANATKHASPTAVAITVTSTADLTVVEVRDDGCGGAGQRAGRGMAGLRDRVEAVGGRLAIDSPPGAGTVLRAELPCASS